MLYLQDDLHENYLLAALPADEWQSLASRLEYVRLRYGQLLADAGETIQHVYFPTTAVISMLYLLEDGATVEVAAVGAEGVVGVPVMMGGGAMPNRVEVRSEGYAYAINAQVFKHEFERSGFLHHLMLLYIQALMTQIAQRALCNRRHSINEQLCGWLLLTQDRLKSDDLPVTQQLIASMLGVRREGVTEAVGKLEKAGLIHCRRGHIVVVDRVGLAEHTCECYGIIKKEFERLLPGPSVKAGLPRTCDADDPVDRTAHNHAVHAA